MKAFLSVNDMVVYIYKKSRMEFFLTHGFSFMEKAASMF